MQSVSLTKQIPPQYGAALYCQSVCFMIQWRRSFTAWQIFLFSGLSGRIEMVRLSVSAGLQETDLKLRDQQYESAIRI